MPQFPILRSALVLVAALHLSGSESIQPGNPVVVHEWGTFTSVAGRNGESVSWAPLNFKSDLPCFVHTFEPIVGKGFGRSLVRMETPVVYFYSKVAAKVSVHVDFPQGWITEWYPAATHMWPELDSSGRAPVMQPGNGGIEWAQLSVLPGSSPVLPSTKEQSRYYAARATDSAPVVSGAENEKLLFYRGVANFRTPFVSVVGPDGVRLLNRETDPVPVAILFNNQNGHIGYSISRNVKDTAFLANPELTGNLSQLRADLTQILVQSGLYAKEAAAMVETWHDTWFEAGMRVFYIMPRAAVDTVLPLHITPAPAETQRIFVARTELLSPWTEATIRTAIAADDLAGLKQFDRFLPVFLSQMSQNGQVQASKAVNAYLNQIQAGGTSSCVR